MNESEQDKPAEAGGDAIEADKDARLWGMLAHLLGIFTFLVGPLVIWLIKKDEHEFVDDQGKEAVNFQITLGIAYFGIGALNMVPVIGCFLLFLYPVLMIVQLVFGIMAATTANKGERYRYPVALRLIT